MDKKPLIVVSICAVVLLVLGSLSNVVGYQSVKSTTVNDSPLFTTRTQRAINQQQNILTSHYLGMGKSNLFKFPYRDNRTESLKRAIEIISKMDDKEFSQFTAFCIQGAKQDKTLSDTNPNEISKAFHQLRIKTESFIYSLIKSNNQQVTFDPFPSVCWFPGCNILLLFAFIYTAVRETIYSIFHPDFPFCPI